MVFYLHAEAPRAVESALRDKRLDGLEMDKSPDAIRPFCIREVPLPFGR